MTYCMNCGKELSEDARYCSQCGAPVEMSEWEEFQVSADNLIGRVKELNINLWNILLSCPFNK